MRRIIFVWKPIQDVGIHAIIAQDYALGYELIGLFSPFQPYSSNFFLTFFEKSLKKKGTGLHGNT